MFFDEILYYNVNQTVWTAFCSPNKTVRTFIRDRQGRKHLNTGFLYNFSVDLSIHDTVFALNKSWGNLFFKKKFMTLDLSLQYLSTSVSPLLPLQLISESAC
jgi:hypothetical protein